MSGWLFLAAYIAGAVLFCRWFYRMHMRQYSMLTWRGTDTLWAIFFSAFWPIAFPLWFAASKEPTP